MRAIQSISFAIGFASFISNVSAFSNFYVRPSSITLDALHIRQSTQLYGTKKLSRPERKALERKKKQQKKNGNEKNGKKKVQPKTLKLHSNNISELTKDSSADDVIKAIKR